MNTNNKSAKNNVKGKNTERDFSTFSPIIKCYNFKDYRHVATNCLIPFNIATVDRVPIEPPKPDSIISPKITPLLKEFSVVPPAAMAIVLFVATITIIHLFLSLTLLPAPSPVITELVDVPSEDLPGKLPLSRDTQHTIELVSGVNLLDLPHHKMDRITPIKLNEQVDQLSLKNEQQCLIPINTHIYEDKFGAICDKGSWSDQGCYHLRSSHVQKLHECSYRRI